MPIDKGTSKPITQLSGLQINYQDKYSCFNPPIVTTSERDALVNTDDPKNPIKDGTTVFNSDSGYEEYYSSKAEKWIQIKEGGGGTGDVTGPNEALEDNIAVFDSTTGKVIKDGGLTIAALQQAKKGKALKATPLYKLSNLGALQFGSNENTADTGTILVDGLTPVTFQMQGRGADIRVCTVINGELGEGSSSPSALLEINSSEGGFLHARMTTSQRDALLDPKDGLEIYNTDTKNLNIRQDGSWVGNVIGPSSAVVNNIVSFDSTTGTLIKDSGFSIQSFRNAVWYNAAGTYAVQPNDFLIGFTLFGSTTLTLPDVNDNIGRLIIVKVIGSSGNLIIRPQPGQAIDSYGSYSMTTPNDSFVCLVAGVQKGSTAQLSSWFIVSQG